ncbi:MAG: 4-(cytidine 5'-diphospho)-2-C-methyl-D-erythritol kinase [Acidimicrobiia bacterium]|nr:4-(cytidine 5'-diphospho)-2-C-methyl-D-erythritol kinase [Acidimicrobiia bacterium]
MRAAPVCVDAYAKLTLSLRITGVRADGYHELEALAISVTEPHDSLVVTLVEGEVTTVSVVGEASAGVPNDASNLASRAARLMRGGGVDVHVHKRIPAGGGLGGGSADAAAVLAALASMTGRRLPPDEVASFGAALGADVPFCLSGGAAWMRGLGERIDPVSLPRLAVLVASPPFAVATADVYRAWDEMGGPRAEREVEPPVGLAGVADVLANDLEPAAEQVEPRLRGFREALEAAAGRSAILAGSGSSCAVLFDHRGDAAAAARRVQESLDCSAWLGAPAPAGYVLDP